MTIDDLNEEARRQQVSDVERMLNQNPFAALRAKWGAVPAGPDRFSTLELLKLPDRELLELWTGNRQAATTGEAFNVRGWYHMLYKDVLRGKTVLDVGSGLAIDGITFAQNGAQITFLDIVESNLALLKRICDLLGVKNVAFHYLESLDSFGALPNFDAIWCQGSLINAPFEFTRCEAQELLKHLPVGGRWIELAYPEERWKKEGEMPFDRWGERTDGADTPWVEWYDLAKIRQRLSPAEFDVVLSFNFYQDDFNWFDLVRTS